MQHDYFLANQSGADFRADLNNALSAIVTVNSGATSPSTTFAHQLWVDTANSVLKIRNSANDAWITTGVSITADNTFDINGGTVNGITSFSFSTGSTVTSILDEDDLSSDSATALATQQSIKAYVDSQVGSVDTLAEILLNGNTTGGTDIAFGDNDKAIFGTGSDLEIYHDGSHSYIDEVGTGSLYIRANDFRLANADGSQNHIIANNNGAVSLRYSGSPKLATTSDGIDVTGTVTADGLTVDGNILLNVEGNELQFNTSSTPVNKIYTDDTYTANGLTISADNGVALKSTNNYLLLDDTGTNEMVLNVDGGERMRVTSTGVAITGNATFGDDDKAIFGTGSDLQIFHNGVASVIQDNGTGNLFIQGSSAVNITNVGSSETYAAFNENGAVALYYDNSSKLATTSSGVNVNGTVVSDGLTLDGTNGKIYLPQTPSTFNWLGDPIEQTGILIDPTNDGSSETIGLYTNNKKRFDIDANGDIAFYDDTGTSQNMVWDASEDSLTFVDNAKATFGASNDLQIYHDGSNSYIKENGTGNLYLQGTSLIISNSVGANYLVAYDGGSVNLYHNANPKLATTSSGVNITGTVTADGLTVDGVARAGSGGVVLTGQYSSSYPNPSANGYFQLKTNNQDANRGGITITRSSDSSGTMLDALKIDYLGDISFYDDTGTTQSLFWDASAESLSIGTTSAAERLTVSGNQNITGKLAIGSASAHPSFDFYNQNTAYFNGAVTIDDNLSVTNGNVGIGTGSPQAKLESYVSGNFSTTYNDFSGDGLYIQTNGTVADGEYTAGISFSRTAGNNARVAGIAGVQEGSDADKTGLAFFTHPSTGTADALQESLRISADGNVGIGTTSPSAALNIVKSGLSTQFRVSNTESDATTKYGAIVGSHYTNAEEPITGMLMTSSSSVTGGSVSIGGGISAANAVNNILFYTAANNTTLTGSEVGRFDSSGNLLVGTTDDSIAGSSTETGINANAIGALVASRTSGASGFFNRLSTDGIIVDLRRDGTTVGQLRGRSGDLIIQTGITGLRFNDANNAIHPVIANGTVSDNATDLGLSNSRFKDIYATNGTIQTSDINEKQDIEDLSKAETRVAVAAKGLLKKYRWKSAVADKGDDARIHFGIMAQDLENAFANEGLDAGDYGMFISSTWTDEATGEEKTRLGVRYNELLAFIIAAI